MSSPPGPLRGPEARRTRPFAVRRFASRVRVGDLLHLTSAAGEVLQRSAHEPSVGYRDGRVRVTLAGGEVYDLQAFAEVLVVGPEEQARYQAWREAPR